MRASLDKIEVNFAQILQSFPTPYLIFHVQLPHFVIVACSETYLEVTKADRNFIMNKDVFDAFPPLPGEEGENTKNDFLTSFERVIKDKLPDVMGLQRYDVPKEDNPNEFTEKYWTVTNSPVLDAHGNVEYIIQRVEDVTEYILLKRQLLHTDSDETPWSKVEAEIMRAAHEVKAANRDIKEFNENLMDQNANLKELDRLKTDFFSNVSHEFRTPLTLMVGPLEDLLSESGVSSKVYGKIEIAHRNALRLLKLVNSLLDFSRLEAGRSKAIFRPVDIAQITKELASHFDSAATKSGIKIVIDCPAMPEPIYLDIDSYEKIVLNLISNAFKHTFEGAIEIKLQWVKNGVKLIVKDSGVGIPADQLEHIFKRFHRVPNAKARTHEGSGIGLALIQELVKLHQGKIEVESVLNQGSQFTVFLLSGNAHLPCEQIERMSERQGSDSTKPYIQEVMHWLEQLRPMPVEQSADNHKERILLADDNSDMRNYIQQLLVPHYEVILATNGKEALDKARIEKPALIISDVMMPHMTGVEMVAAIRHDEKLKLTPVILLSARAGEEAKIKGLETGADDYLIKPFNATELLAKIKTNLAMQNMRLENHLQLEKITKLKDQFISNMSHELRTPLNAIIGYSEMIVNRMVDCEDTKHSFVENIRTAGRHLLVLINDMLDLSKIEAGKIALNIQWFNVKEFVLEIDSLMKELAAKNKVFVEFYIPEGLAQIKADQVRLKQIMINLLNNAIKFNRENGKVEVKLQQTQDNKWVDWQITDTGIGIPKDKINQLFTEFYRVQNGPRSYEGTGLGLALTKKLIHLHGGDITVSSEENVGSTFKFSLPLNDY